MSVVRSALAGLSTGCRTFTGFGAVTLTAQPDARDQPDAVLGTLPAKGIVGALALAELVADKLPSTPSRLDFPGIHGRVLFAAASGAAIARRSAAVASPDPTVADDADDAAQLAPGRPQAPPAQIVACALAAVAASVGSAWLGFRFRDWASTHIGNDVVSALIEDSVAVGLAFAAVKAPGPAV